MLVKDVMTRDVECTNPTASLDEAAQRMRELDVGVMPVCDGDKFVGILTDRDITVRSVAEGDNPRTTRVGDVMSPEVISCFEDQTVEEAAQIMERRLIRRLVVLKRDNKLAGIVSLGDLALHADRDLAGKALQTVSEPVEAPNFNKSSGVLDNPTDRVQVG